MVGAIKLVKLLHCKRLQKNKAIKMKSEDSLNTDTNSLVPINIKVENNDNDVNKICRVCLKTGDIPIYNNNLTGNLSDALRTFADIVITVDDTYPKSLCQSCYALLQGAILFRKTAQESELLLRQQSSCLTENEHNDSHQTHDYIEGDSDDDHIYSEQIQETQNDAKYYCKRCDLEFDTEKDCRDHRLSDEHDNRRIMCTICNKSYNAIYYKKHEAIHKKDEQYMCDVCGKKFIFRGHLSRHHMTHFYKLPFKCSLCPYKGRFTESLKLHMRTHTGEKPYECTQCSARFISKSNLNKHTRTHKSQYDFKCHCGRGFYTQRNLDMHLKVEHTGIKDHVCNICGKPFGYRKQMMKHQLKVHKREKLRSGRTPLYLQVESMKMKGVHVAES